MTRVADFIAPARSGADSPRLLGQINDQIVFGLLLDHGPMTRSEIGQATRLSKPTVSTLLDRLAARTLIEPAGLTARGPGPKAQIYRVNAAAAHVLAIHVEQRGSAAAVATLTGEVVGRHEVWVPDRSVADPRDEVRAAIDGVLSDAALHRADIDRIIIATPGIIDPETGTLRHAQHLQGWEEPGLRAALSDELGIPVTHDNDVNLAAVAEGIRGAAQQCRDYALIWLGRGVGLGVVTGGQVRTGAHGGAGEIGYLPVHGVEDVPRTDRGETGAFQQRAGGQGLRALADQHGIAGTTPVDIVTHAAHGGDPGAALLREFGFRVALGAAAVASVIDPEVIVFGGPVALAGAAPLLATITDAFQRHSFLQAPLALSEVNDGGVITGAIETGLQQVRSGLFGQPVSSLLPSRP